jgi:hypothetical protein
MMGREAGLQIEMVTDRLVSEKQEEEEEGLEARLGQVARSGGERSSL